MRAKKLGKHARSYVVYIVIPDKIRFFLIKQYICLLYPNDYSRLRFIKTGSYRIRSY